MTNRPPGVPAEAPWREDVEPLFRHLDDMKWQQVRTQMHPDGQKSVWEKWFAFGRDPQYLSMYAKWDPGMVVHPHGHYSPQAVYVLEGGMFVGERWCPKGTHIELPLGAALGACTAGPDGVELFEVMMGDPRSWPVDPQAFRDYCTERGIQQLPDPPIDLPDWIADRRGDQHK